MEERTKAYVQGWNFAYEGYSFKEAAFKLSDEQWKEFIKGFDDCLKEYNVE